MTWNTQNNIVTGTPLTTTLWNNDLGTNGSLKYVYNELTTTQLKRNIILYKTTATVFSGASTVQYTFNAKTPNYTDQELNFPITLPVSDIPFPAEGMYVATFQFTVNANILFRNNFVVTDTLGGSVYNYTSSSSVINLEPYTHICMFYVPNATTTLKVFGQTSATAQTNPIFPNISNNYGSQVLTIARI